MSASLWDQSLASANGLLTNEECFMLLDFDILNTDEDLLKSLPPTTPKFESATYQLQEEHTLYPPSPPEAKPTRAELASDLLQQLENQYKQENIFPNWLEEKVELPIFDNIPEVSLPTAVLVHPPIPVSYSAPQHTEELLREFDTVLGAVELTHLTPPQSPPGPASQLLVSYAQQAQCSPLSSTLAINHTQEQWAAAPISVTSVPVEYDCELQAVEELVRHRAAELQSPLSQDDSSNNSPTSSPPSSPRSFTDEEWSAPSRPKPYSRPVEDRRSRKKEQNKNAATRYRQKKKAEVEVLLSEENNLRQRHTDLGEKCSDLQREIRYLKGLMRDLFKAKGLIK